VKGPVINYVKEKKAKFRQCKKVLFKGRHLKGQVHYLQLKNIHEKLKRQKDQCKNSRDISFKSGRKKFVSQA
jgi:hypothetical protein